jgi:hypothetical protein
MKLKRSASYLREKANILGVELDFTKEPLDVSNEIADYCLKNFPDRFIIEPDFSEEKVNKQELFLQFANENMELEELKDFIRKNEILPSLKGTGAIKTTKSFIDFVLKELE